MSTLSTDSATVPPTASTPPAAPAPHNRDEQWRNVRLSDIKHVFTDAVVDAAYVAPTTDADAHTTYVFNNGVSTDCAQASCPSELVTELEKVAVQDISAQWIATAAQHYTLSIDSDCQLRIYNYASNGASACSLDISVAAGVRADIVLIHDVHSDARSSFALRCDAAVDSVVRIDEIEQNLNQGQLLRHAFLRIAQDANVQWIQCQLGSTLNRSCTTVDLHQHHAHCYLGAASMCHAEQQAHQYVRVNHQQLDTTSKQVFKCIADDHARFSFDGLIDINADADGSSAEQINANLQLSDTCRVHSRPQLDIDTDDVIATHGSATGQINAEEIHYLQSRGISERNARRLITRGFLQEVMNDFHSEYAQTHSKELLHTLLG